MSCKGLTGKALTECKAKQKATVTTASIRKVKNNKINRTSLSTIESENRVFQKKVRGSKVKRKSYTLQDDGSLRIARNTSSNPKGSVRTVSNPKRASKIFNRAKTKLNNNQSRFNNRARQ